MTLPSFLASSFAYSNIATVDSQDVLDEIIDQITVQLPVADRWTSLGAGVYQSKSLDGFAITLTISRVDATDIQFTVYSGALLVYNGRHRITALANVDIFSGPYHIALVTGTTGDYSYASILDASPFNFSSQYGVAANVFRDSGSNTSSFNATTLSIRNVGQDCIMGFYSVSASVVGKTLYGSTITIPAEVVVIPTTGTSAFGGKLTQMICVPSFINAGTTLTIPLDTGVVGDFKALPGNIYSSLTRLAVRKA